MSAEADLKRIERRAFRDTQQDGLMDLAMGCVLFVVALGPGLRALKARYTYPRIGCAELPDEDPKQFRWGVLSFVVGCFAVMALALYLLDDVTNNLSWRQWSPALGVLISLQTFSEPYGAVRVWALSMALLLLATGGVIFSRFLRDHPVVESRNPDKD